MILCTETAFSLPKRQTMENLIRISNESPIVMMRWKHAPGWPVEFISGNISKWGYTEEEFLEGSRNFESIVHPDDVHRMSSEANRQLGERQTQFEQFYRIVKSDGSIVWIDDRTWVEYDERGEPLVISGVLIDITARIEDQTENEIRRERLEQAIHASNIGFYDYRAATGDIYYSREWKSQLGYDENELENHFDTWVALLHPDDRDNALRTLEDFSNNPLAIQYHNTFRLRRKDSEYAWITARGTAERNSDGIISKLVGSHIDVTDRVEQETALQNALRDKNILLSEIHHRVKNNLAIISSILQLQVDRLETTREQAIFLETISKVKSISLVHEALYQNTTLTKIPIHEYLPRVAAAIQETFDNGEKIIRMNLNFNEYYVSTDSAIPLGLLVNEVMTNSYKHAFNGKNEGEITISLKVELDAAILEIRDNGIGLPDTPSVRNDSLGMQIISGLSTQLNGELKILNDNGAVIQLTLSAS